MGAGTFGEVGEGVEHGTVAGDLEGLHGGGVLFVRGGVGGDGGGELLGLEWQMKSGA